MGTTIVEVQGEHHDMLTTQIMSDLYAHLTKGEALKSKY